MAKSTHTLSTVGQCWNGQTVTNTLAYHRMVLNTSVEGFIDTTTILRITLLIMTILITLNMSGIVYDNITCKRLYV